MCFGRRRLILLSLWCLCRTVDLLAVETEHPWTLHYDQPAQQWVEALPVGNGRLGAMVFGGIGEERLQLNEDTLWSGGPKDWNNPEAKKWLPRVRRALFAGDYIKAGELCKKMQGPYNQSYQPLGDLILDFKHEGEAANYARELDLDRGIARTRYQVDNVTFSRMVFASHPDQVIVMGLRANKRGRISFTAMLKSQLKHTVRRVGSQRLLLRGRCPQHVEPNYRKVEPAVIYDESGRGEGMRFAAMLQAVTNDGEVTTTVDGRLKVNNATRVVLLLAADTSFNGFDKSPGKAGVDPQKETKRNLEAAAKQSWRQLVRKHVQDHQSLFRRVHLDLGPSATTKSPASRWHAARSPLASARIVPFAMSKIFRWS